MYFHTRQLPSHPAYIPHMHFPYLHSISFNELNDSPVRLFSISAYFISNCIQAFGRT